MANDLPAHTRGFLFSDLRGYSAFTERHGDQAARKHLTSYRQSVREVIGKFDGAEIRTEGDSFYVVFDSVSQAVRAGLAILAAVAEPSADAAAHPVLVGIGIHAGETEDSAEGIVSSAVNVAARICAQAEPGELLVSDTVRALTRSYLDISFQPRGRRRLKGIAEPVALYRVVAGRGEAVARGNPLRSALSRPWLQRAGLTAAVAIAILAIAIIGNTLLREGVASDDRGASAGPAASQGTTQASPNASELGAASAFPTAAEQQLLGFIDEASRDRCERGDEGPVYLSTYDFQPVPVPANFVAAVDCKLDGISGPDRVEYWQLTSNGTALPPPAPPSGTLNAELLVHDKAGRNGATAASSCSPGVPALERWSFGELRGLLVCYETVTGDAILWWTYDGTEIVATAVRDDRDMAALLAWWTAEARFAP